METLKQLLHRATELFPDRVFLRYKTQSIWQTRTYGAFSERVGKVATYLHQHDIKPGDRVALCMDNGPEWMEIYMGIVCIGAIAVPIDARLREQEVAHILSDSGSGLLFTDARHYAMVRDLAPQTPQLEKVILFGYNGASPTPSRKIEYEDYADLLNAEISAAWPDQDPTRDDVASFIYTSGTTGRQKGAMLTHFNFISNVIHTADAFDISDEENFLLLLPLHHSLAFTTSFLIPIYAGAEVSFVESLRTVSENIREVSPTIMMGVPLLAEKMYARIMTNLQKNKLAYTLFRLGLRQPVRKAVLKGLGGKLRIFGIGGAPCDPDVLQGFQQLGINILEGYGLTETAPAVSFSRPENPIHGTVGPPIDCMEVKIRDANSEGVGEISLRGDNVMKGYYNNPEATAEVFDGDWFLTGDLGKIDHNGHLVITGRKKSLIVNREGKNIYPEEVENQICKSPFISEALVLGYQEPSDKIGERVGVIVVPDQEAMDQQQQESNERLSDAQHNKLIIQEVKKELQHLADYKRPRRIQIRTEEFEKTSTSKIKRYLYAMEVEELGE